MPVRSLTEDDHTDHFPGAPQGLRGGYEFERLGAQFAAALFRDDQDAAHAESPLNSRMMVASRAACAAAPPSMSCACPLSGTNMRRTRDADPSSPTSAVPSPRSASETTSMGFAAACLMLRSEAYRGVLMPNWMVSTAGHRISTSCSRPPSSSRRNTAVAAPGVKVS